VYVSQFDATIAFDIVMITSIGFVIELIVPIKYCAGSIFYHLPEQCSGCRSIIAYDPVSTSNIESIFPVFIEMAAFCI
jgi:hypothetical protein